MLDVPSAKAYTDFSQFAEMRLNAQQNPEGSLEAVAKQFEGIFVSMMLKSMRDASFGDPIFDSDQSDMYRDMFDKQLTQDMTNGRGIGLADALILQMKKYVPSTENESATEGAGINNKVNQKNDPFIINRETTHFKNKEQFIETMLPYAESAAEELGVSANVLVAQAALETGWGSAVGKLPSGKSSFNLFNIKAGSHYDGDKYSKQTVEFTSGIKHTEKASFRAYGNYQESFDDYVNFIKTNPRYEDALNKSNSENYIKGIQQAGYATDPHYADKVNRVLGSIPIDSELSTDEVV